MALVLPVEKIYASILRLVEFLTRLTTENAPEPSATDLTDASPLRFVERLLNLGLYVGFQGEKGQGSRCTMP